MHLVPTEGLRWRKENDFEAATLYLMPIKKASFVGFSDDDTMASHDGWVEEQGYSQSARPEYVKIAGGGGYTTNTPGALITANQAIEVVAYALVTNSTKGGSTGTILDLVDNDGTSISLQSGENLLIQYDDIYESG